jgi:hypothetical protein
MDSTSAASITALTRRWQEQLTLLQAQLTSAPAITVASTRGRLRALYEQAQLAGAALPCPVFADEVFTSMTFSSNAAQAIAKFATEEAEREKQRLLRNKQAREYRQRIRDRAGVKRHKPPKPDLGPNDCLCGCGGKTGRSFIQGHSALWYNWMKRIERGEMPRESLNQTLQERLRWCRCLGCGGFIPTTDPFGRPIAKRVGYDCQRRERRLKNTENVDPRLKAALSGDEKEVKRLDVCANHSAYVARKAKNYAGPRRLRGKEGSKLQ